MDSEVLEDRAEIGLSEIFKNLTELHVRISTFTPPFLVLFLDSQIDRCHPKIISDLATLSPQLERLTVSRSVSQLSELLALPNSTTESPWRKLKELRMPHNYVVGLDDSLMLLTMCASVDLSHNLIERIENLQFCYNLSSLDLSFNRIRSVHSSVHFLGNLKSLMLRGNGLSSTLGLEKLLGLERLDLRENSLSSFEDIARLARLPLLDALLLSPNPITQKKNYRREVYLHLHKETLVLDGLPPSRQEKEIARSVSQPSENLSTHGVLTPPFSQAIALFGHPPAARQNDTSKRSPLDNSPPALSSSFPVRQDSSSSRRSRPKRVAPISSVEPEDAATADEVPLRNTPIESSAMGFSPGGTMSPLRETIDKLHEGHGASWLLVYNEFKKSKFPSPPSASPPEQEQEPPITLPPPREVAEPATVVPHPTAETVSTKPKSILHGPFVSMPIVTAGTTADSPTGSDVAPSAVPELDLIDSISTESPPSQSYGVVVADDKSPESRISSSPLPGVPTPDPESKIVKEVFQKTEEFYAEVQTESGDWDPRILIISDRFLEEGDTTTGSSVVRNDLKHLVDVRNLSEEASGGVDAIVRLDFRSAGATSSHQVTCFYKLESQKEAASFVSLLQKILSKSTRKLKCMACQTIFNIQSAEACPNCQSAVLIGFDDSIPVVASNPGVDVVAAAPASSSVPAGWTESEPPLDGNRQLYLKLTFFKKDDNSETLVSYFPCPYLPYGLASSREAPSAIMLSNLNLYLLQPKSRRRTTMILSAFLSDSSEDDEDELLCCIPFSEVKRIVVGPFYQWFRLEAGPQQIFLFASRAHERTHHFVNVLKQTIRDKIGYVEVSNRNQETIQNLISDCGLHSRPELELFLWVFQRVKPGAGRTFPQVTGHNISLSPRTMVVTAEELLIVDEDVRFPHPLLSGYVRPKAPQFIPHHRRKISELSSIEIDPQQPNFLRLCFDDEFMSASSSRSAPPDGGKWSIFCQRSLECRKIRHTLTREWAALFQVPLAVVELSGAAGINS